MSENFSVLSDLSDDLAGHTSSLEIKTYLQDCPLTGLN